jgi:hypothetical protein
MKPRHAAHEEIERMTAGQESGVVFRGESLTLLTRQAPSPDGRERQYEREDV